MHRNVPLSYHLCLGTIIIVVCRCIIVRRNESYEDLLKFCSRIKTAVDVGSFSNSYQLLHSEVRGAYSFKVPSFEDSSVKVYRLQDIKSRSQGNILRKIRVSTRLESPEKASHSQDFRELQNYR